MKSNDEIIVVNRIGIRWSLLLKSSSRYMKARPEHDACLSCALCSSFKYQGPVYVQSGSWPLHIFHVYERSKKHQLFCKGGASISASSNILGSIKLRNRIIQIRLY